ncbi:MAG: omega-amidase [Lentimonas sp.]|jgi:omega-amidase
MYKWHRCIEIMKVALAQFKVVSGQADLNLIEIERYLFQAKTEGASVVFLPEMCTTGLIWHFNPALLESAAAGVERVRLAAQRNRISVCGSFLEQTPGGNAANTLYYFNAAGVLIAKYRKVHLFTMFHEEAHIEAGNEIIISDTDLGRTGFSICYDLRFPELFRKCALAGAEFQVLVAAFPHPRLEHWRTLIRARAIENQSFFIAVNQCGYEGAGAAGGEIKYFGHSMIVDPWGEVVLEAGEEAGLFTAELDCSLPTQVRAKLTALQDRRPDLY